MAIGQSLAHTLREAIADPKRWEVKDRTMLDSKIDIEEHGVVTLASSMPTVLQSFFVESTSLTDMLPYFAALGLIDSVALARNLFRPSRRRH